MKTIQLTDEQYNALKKYIIENDSDWKTDWDDRNSVDASFLQAAGILYCSEQCCKALVKLLNGGWLKEKNA